MAFLLTRCDAIRGYKERHTTTSSNVDVCTLNEASSSSTSSDVMMNWPLPFNTPNPTVTKGYKMYLYFYLFVWFIKYSCPFDIAQLFIQLWSGSHLSVSLDISSSRRQAGKPREYNILNDVPKELPHPLRDLLMTI